MRGLRSLQAVTSYGAHNSLLSRRTVFSGLAVSVICTLQRNEPVISILQRFLNESCAPITYMLSE